MEFGGQYIGLGEGDRSPALPEIKRHLKRKFTPARNTLDESDLFTPALTVEVKREQAIFMADGRLKTTDVVVPGVINLAFKYACGFMSREKILPLHFSVEGHMSDMWVGPAAYVGEVLRAEGRALHFPTWYDRFALPFKNQTGVAELTKRLSSTEFTLDNGTRIKFPAGTPFTFSSFSQGSMIWYDFYHQQLAPGKPLNWRLKDIRAAIVCGDPNREMGKCVDWIPDPPPIDHQGIMDVRWEDTPWWMLELAREGDMYTDNESSGERGLNKTAIAKIITQNKWSGGPAGLLSRVGDLVSPMDDLIPVTLALYDAIRFGVGGIRKHGGYEMEPAVQFCRERLASSA